MLRTVTLLACVAAVAACGQMSGSKTGTDTTASAGSTAAPAASGDNKPAEGAAAPGGENSGPKPTVAQAPAGSTPAKP